MVDAHRSSRGPGWTDRLCIWCPVVPVLVKRCAQVENIPKWPPVLAQLPLLDRPVWLCLGSQKTAERVQRVGQSFRRTGEKPDEAEHVVAWRSHQCPAYLI